MDGYHPLALARGLLDSHGAAWAELLLAYALAFVIGWNRERQSRSAGLRTFPLVAVAACGIVQATAADFGANPEAWSRVVQGIITGIGFIGAGAILKGGEEVHGTATAASVWATGAIGAAIGLGSYAIAIAVWLFTTVTLIVLTRLKPDRPAEQAEERPGR